MLTRRSLGDSPLEHTSDEDVALLDFIGRGQKATEKHEKPEQKTEVTEVQPSKKIVSYYLDNDVVRKLKFLATITDRSYSSLVEEGLKKLLQDYGF